MYDLLKKLNTLVSAQVNDAISRLPNIERKPDLNRQVNELRQRVAAALEYEDNLRAQVGSLQTEIAGLDSRINEAISAGQETTARGLLEEVQRLQKRLALAESDLRQHQNSAADLIIRVNELESAVGDLNSAQRSAPAAPRTTEPDSAAPRPAGTITDYMPPRADETPAKPAAPVRKNTPEPAAPAPDLSLLNETPRGAIELPPPAESAPKKKKPKPAEPAASTTPVKPTEPAEPTKPAEPTRPDQPARQPWDKPRTAKEAAEWALEDAEQTQERAETGVEQVGGLLRDIQSRVTQHMSDLDQMLKDGGLTDETGAAKPIPKVPPAGKPKDKPDDDDLSDRLSRLTKPE